MSISSTRCLGAHLKVSSISLSKRFPRHFSFFLFKTCLDLFVNWNFSSCEMFVALYLKPAGLYLKTWTTNLSHPSDSFLEQTKTEQICGTLLITWYRPKYWIFLFDIFVVTQKPTPIYTYCLDLPLSLPCFSHLSSDLRVPHLRAADTREYHLRKVI